MVSTYRVVSADSEVIEVHDPFAPSFRSTLNPVSFIELSVHETMIFARPSLATITPLGATGAP